MKFNIFKKPKKEKSTSPKGIDFLKYKDSNLSDLENNVKADTDKKKNSFKENKENKKENEKEQKKKKAEAKEAKKKKKAEAKEAKKKKKAEAQEAKKKAEEKEKLKKKEAKNEEAKEAKEKKEEKEAKEEKNKTKKEVKENKISQDKKSLEQEREIKEESKEDIKENSSHEFEKSNVLEINLVKDEINVYFDWYKNIAMLIVFIFLSLVIVGEIYLALSWWQSKNDSAVSQEEERFIKLNEETRKIRDEAEEALIFQNKLNRANHLLENHLYWSNFFNYLEKNTLESISYTSFEGNILGDFSIPAISNNFSSLGQQKYQLQSDKNTLGVDIESGKKLDDSEEDLGKVEFDIDLTVSPELFKNN